MRALKDTTGGGQRFYNVATIVPGDQGLLDTNGSKIYTISTKQVLPENCWRQYDLADDVDHITVIRVSQNGSNSGTLVFDKSGLKCMGRWNGRDGSWLAGME